MRIRQNLEGLFCSSSRDERQRHRAFREPTLDSSRMSVRFSFQGPRQWRNFLVSAALGSRILSRTTVSSTTFFFDRFFFSPPCRRPVGRRSWLTREEVSQLWRRTFANASVALVGGRRSVAGSVFRFTIRRFVRSTGSAKSGHLGRPSLLRQAIPSRFFLDVSARYGRVRSCVVPRSRGAPKLLHNVKDPVGGGDSHLVPAGYPGPVPK